MKSVSIGLLDDDCWEMIFKRLEDNSYDLASVSLACKRFLFITNQLKISLLVSNSTLHLFTRLIQRFRNLKSIEFCIKSKADPDRLITQISQSGLQHLEALKSHEISVTIKLPGECFRELGIKMKGLKRLDLTGLYYFCDGNLIVLKNFFPCLEELNITDYNWEVDLQITDDAIEALTSKLNRLKKVTLLNCKKITDKSLMCLSSNCPDLKNVSIKGCMHVSENGIGFLMRYSPKLTSLSLDIQLKSFWQKESEFTFENSVTYASNLEHLELDGMIPPDAVLYAIARASPPLKSFHYLISEEGDINGLAMLLSSCPSLKEFTTRGRWVTNTYILAISKHFGGLTHIDLSSCSGLSSAAFFTLTKNCPLLESIFMLYTRGGDCQDMYGDFHQNYRMKHLDLSGCLLMNDDALVRFGLVCPNLEILKISDCDEMITDIGVLEFLRVCSKLKHLDVSELNVSNFVGPCNEASKLKLTSVFADDTRINDQALEMMGKRCPDLEELNIKRCQNVTKDGVKELMSKCEKLRKIDMRECKNVSIDLLEWTTNSRLLLRKILAPSGFDPSVRERNLFLHNGYYFG